MIKITERSVKNKIKKQFSIISTINTITNTTNAGRFELNSQQRGDFGQAIFKITYIACSSGQHK